MTVDADYIIIGAGSAGCVLANRLSARPGTRVLLLEAGGSDRLSADPRSILRSLMIRIPAGFTSVMNDPGLNWGYMSEPDDTTGGRRYQLARGRVLGGSSSINGMTYVRGLPSDYDGWRQLGCEGWSWGDVLPVFREAERQERGGDDHHGADGPMTISDAPFRHPMSEPMRKAFQEAGVPATDDVNGPTPEGVTYAQAAIDRGRRHSGAAAYLHPVMNRDNLDVWTHTTTLRIVFEGKRACGVEVLRDGRRHTLAARREVILAAGAIASPRLLELSGIGSGARLAGLGIEVLHDQPAVGESLQDHYSALLQLRLKPGTPSLNADSQGLGLVRQLIRYFGTRGGLLAAGASQLTALARSRPEVDLPDMQYFSSPATVDGPASAARGRMVLEGEPGTTLGGYQLRPRSRGSVHLTSPDPIGHPAIRLNYLSDPFDQQTIVAGLRLARRILSQPALAPYAARLLTPDPDLMNDEEVLDYARATGSTAYHYAGTCRMGDETAVLTPRLAVRGVEALRVIDAAAMPRLVSGNTNAAVVMMAEKGAAMILQDAGA